MARLTEAQQALAAKPEHREWTENLLRSQIRACPWLDEEYRTAALLSLVYAAQTFDAARHVEFTTYLTFCVERGFRTAFRRARRPHRYGPHVEPLHPSIDPVDPRRDEPGRGETMRILLASLPYYQADLLSRIFVAGDTLTDAGRHYGLSKQTAKNHLTRALQTLRTHPVLAGAR